MLQVNIDTVNLYVSIIEGSNDVPGIQNLVVQNDYSVLDVAKPMPIFGNQPVLGSKLHIGSHEIFQKNLLNVLVKFQWVDLSTELYGFWSHYWHYQDDFDNHDFKVRLDILDKKEWVTIEENQNLFTTSNSQDVGIYDTLPTAEEPSAFYLSGTTLRNIEKDESLDEFTEYDQNSSKGFLRLTLKGRDFGHKLFSTVYTEHAIALANGTGTGLPLAPYIPIIKDLSIYYSAQVSFNLNSSTANLEDQDIVEQFFHIEPFGNYEVDKSDTSNSLLPVIEHEGSLFIGLDKLNPSQTLSLLIQVAEGSANPDKAQQKVIWSYLSGNKWVDFDQYSLLSDGTNGLLSSGIVKFNISKTASNDDSRMTPGLHWLKASVAANSDAICDVIDIQTQAISATFKEDSNDPKFLENALEAGTISKLINADASVKKVEQPYASYDGKPEEKERSFYTRVSERLRHKNRAITIWDYEHLVLDKFSKVYKAKCINHTKFDGTITNYSEMAPGHVTIIVIANVQNKNAIDPLRPKASLDQLSEIDSFIKAINPPCVKLHVKNPIYEEVKVNFKVKFHVGVDAGYYLTKLNEEIKHFLSPWASACSTDIAFGGRIHKSVILNFVEERSYVDYVTCFKMFHIVHEDPTISLMMMLMKLLQPHPFPLSGQPMHT